MASAPPATATTPLIVQTLPAAPAAPPESKSHLKVIIIILIILVLGVGVALLVWYFVDRKPAQEGDDCSATTDCDAGLVCTSGKCAKPVTPACTTSADCPSDQVCQSGSCVTAKGGYTQPCKTDGTCNSGYTCTGGGVCLVAEDNTCAADNDCASSFCDPANLKCAEPECATVDDCAQGQTCDSTGHCIGSAYGSLGQPCRTTDPTCDATYACASGTCLLDAGQPCTADTAGLCASKTCTNELCASSDVDPACTSDANCGTGRYCQPITHTCAARVAAAQACSSSVKCLENLTCTSGFCQYTGETNGAVGSACGTASATLHCDAGLVCDNAACRLPVEGETCTATCDYGLECVGGMCAKPACYCVGNGACGADDTCHAVTTINISPYGGCAAGQAATLMSLDSKTGALGPVTISLSGGTTLPTVTALIEQGDWQGEPNPALVSAEGLFSFTSTALVKALPGAVSLSVSGATVPATLESCSAGYALFRSQAAPLKLYLVRLTPGAGSDTNQSYDVSSYTYAQIGSEFAQSVSSPATVSSFYQGRIILCSRGAAGIIYSSTTQTGPSSSFDLKQQALDSGWIYDKPQVLGDNFFAVLAVKGATSTAVYLNIYWYSVPSGQSVAAWRLYNKQLPIKVPTVASQPAGTAALAQIASVSVVSTPYGAADPTKSTINFCYVYESPTTKARTLYDSTGKKLTDVSSNAVIGSNQLFTDCLS